MNATQFAELLISLSLQAALVVVVTHWLTHVVSGERAHCRMWTMCYLSMLLLVAAGVLLAHPRFFRPWYGFDAQVTASLASIQSRVGQYLFVAWLTGALGLIVLFAIRSWRVQRFLKSCSPVDPSFLQSMGLGGVALSQAGRPSCEGVNLLTSAQIATPFCWQFHRPYIVLPEFLLGSDGSTVPFILRHEMEHLRTGHPLQLFLQRIVEILFWFHPMIWWASHQSARAREFACDAAAVESRSEIAAYLRSLLTIVEHAALKGSESTSTMTFGRGGTLVAERARRLVRLAQGPLPSRSKRTVPPGIAMAGLVVFTIIVAALWFPVDALASRRANWSRWPTWSSAVLHDFGISAPDFETYDRRSKLSELDEHEATIAIPAER